MIYHNNVCPGLQRTQPAAGKHARCPAPIPTVTNLLSETESDTSDPLTSLTGQGFFKNSREQCQKWARALSTSAYFETGRQTCLCSGVCGLGRMAWRGQVTVLRLQPQPCVNTELGILREHMTLSAHYWFAPSARGQMAGG